MTRRLLVKLIASVCIAKGLWDIGDFLYPFFFLSAPIAIKVFPFIGGILEIYAGINLFRLSESGRKVILALLSISVVISVIVIFWTIFFWKVGYASAVYFLDDVIFQSENRLITAGIDFVFFAIPLLIILFLSQDKTKSYLHAK